MLTIQCYTPSFFLLGLRDELDDGEVLNELDKKFAAYFDPFLPMNIITSKACNIIMVEGLESTGRNVIAIVRDVYVFVGSFTYVANFVVLEDIREFIISDMTDVVMGRPFRVLYPSRKIRRIRACAFGNGYSLKDKNEAKTDKTEHGNEKSVKSQSQSQKVKVKVEAKDVCILNGPTRTPFNGSGQPIKPLSKKT
ncbi:hypothetical protein Tco_0025839 [Tanacetum coccineum]